MHIAVLADNIADRKQTERLLDRANSALASEIGTLYVDSFGDESSFLPVCMKYDLFLFRYRSRYGTLYGDRCQAAGAFCARYDRRL